MCYVEPGDVAWILCGHVVVTEVESMMNVWMNSRPLLACFSRENVDRQLLFRRSRLGERISVTDHLFRNFFLEQRVQFSIYSFGLAQCRHQIDFFDKFSIHVATGRDHVLLKITGYGIWLQAYNFSSYPTHNSFRIPTSSVTRGVQFVRQQGFRILLKRFRITLAISWSAILLWYSPFHSSSSVFSAEGHILCIALGRQNSFSSMLIFPDFRLE